MLYFSAQFVEMPEKVGFSEDQILEFQECFYLFDTKGDAKIPVREHVRKMAKFFFYIYLLILTLLPQQSIYMLTFIRNVQFPAHGF